MLRLSSADSRNRRERARVVAALAALLAFLAAGPAAFCQAGSSAAQAGASGSPQAGTSGAQAAASAAQPAPQPLPRGFRGISLGMGLDQVKQALRSDPLFLYRGDPDVSFLPQTHQYLVECAGASFLRRAWFQFSDGRLYIMILALDAQKLDHYTLFSALSAKYGPPTSLSPQETVWQSDSVRFSLERPLTVKYIDRAVFGAGLEAGKAPQDLEQLSREKFIEQF